MATPEARSEQSPSGEPLIFHLTHVGNQEVIDSLTRFRKEGMNGPRAAFHLLSLFEPLPVGEDDMGLIKSGETTPQTLFDQVGWIYANPQILTEEQRGAPPALLFSPLESLANNPQVRRVGGEERDLSAKARQIAQETFESYGNYLAKTLDPDNPESVKALKTIRAFGKAAPLVLETIVLAACAANIKAASAIKVEIPTPIPTMIATEVSPSPAVEVEKLENFEQHLIGNSGVGTISEFNLRKSLEKHFSNEVKTRVLRMIPWVSKERLNVTVFDMVGPEGKAPFVAITVNGERGERLAIYTGFAVDENGVQRPPYDGKIAVLYRLHTSKMLDGTDLVGTMRVEYGAPHVYRELFWRMEDRMVFLSPYTDPLYAELFVNQVRPTEDAQIILDFLFPPLPSSAYVPFDNEFRQYCDVSGNEFPCPSDLYCKPIYSFDAIYDKGDFGTCKPNEK